MTLSGAAPIAVPNATGAGSLSAMFFEGSWRELIEPLRDGLIGMTIGALRNIVPAGLVQRPLFQDRLVVVGRAGHPLLGSTVEAAALPAFLGRRLADSLLRNQRHQLFAGQEPPAPIECGSMMVIRGSLLKPTCRPCCAEQVAADMTAGLLAIVCEPRPASVRTIGITVRAGWQPTAAQTRLIGLLETAASRHTSGKQITTP